MNVTYERISKMTIGGAGNGNSYNFKVRRGDLVTLAHGERDVASAFEYAGLPVPAELRGPYDCYGRLDGEAKRAFEEGVRDGGLDWSVANEWTMSKHLAHYAAGFAIGSAARNAA